VRKPFLKLAIAGAGGGGGGGVGADGDATEQTAPCATPRASDPNFLQRLVLPCALPRDAAFAPVLRVAAHDRWLGGLRTPLIGAERCARCCSVWGRRSREATTKRFGRRGPQPSSSPRHPSSGVAVVLACGALSPAPSHLP
jgi:hypothetical protein